MTRESHRGQYGRRGGAAVRAAVFGLVFCSHLAGCAGGGSGHAAYLSLSDMAMVAGGGHGGLARSFPILAVERPARTGRFVAAGGISLPYELTLGVDGKSTLIRISGDGESWYKVDGEASARLQRAAKKGGGVEVFGETLAQRLGIGGLGI